MKTRDCDVCIVGSGASGGIAALVLAQNGFRVTLLEAGPTLNIERDYKQHTTTYDFKDRGIDIKGVGETPLANGFWKIDGEPYSCTNGTQFHWFRSRILGGRTNHWGRGVARFSPEDLKQRSLTGVGEDWPLTYEELKPYYEAVEDYVGVVGPTVYFEGPRSDMPMPPSKCYEKFIEKTCQQLGMKCIPTASAIVTRPHNGRSGCHYCAQCYKGCKVAAAFSIAQTAIPDALASGKLQLITEAMAREVLVDSRGFASGVSYVDKRTHQLRSISAHCVVVAASACESARLLLNSTSTSFPLGLANSSRVVGRFLKDSVGVRALGHFPALKNAESHNCDGFGRPHIMLPWVSTRESTLNKGYEILFMGGRIMPLMGMFDIHSDEVEGFGSALKQSCRDTYGSYVHFVCTGEMASNESNYCEVDHRSLDMWGIPVLKFHFAWSSEEYRMADHMLQTTRRIIDAAGGRYLGQPNSPPLEMTSPGENFHEVGTVRMGESPETSALNSFCQSHDCPNLFVVDGASFVTLPEKPPTLTIMALARRAADHIVELSKRGECNAW